MDVAPTGGWQNWTTVSTPITGAPAGTHTLYIVFTTRPKGGLMNVNWFQVHGKGAAVSAPPEVTATATPDDRRGAAGGEVRRHGDRPRGRGTHVPVGLRRRRHDDDTSTQEDPTYTYANAGTYTAKVTVTDAAGIRGTAPSGTVTTPPDQCHQDAKSDEFDGSRSTRSAGR